MPEVLCYLQFDKTTIELQYEQNIETVYHDLVDRSQLNNGQKGTFDIITKTVYNLEVRGFFVWINRPVQERHFFIMSCLLMCILLEPLLLQSQFWCCYFFIFIWPNNPF